jgi:hypothetical protein
MGILCLAALALAGCNDSVINSGIAHSGDRTGDSPSRPSSSATSEDSSTDTAKPEAPPDQPDAGTAPGGAADVAVTTPDDPARPRTFAVEGPDGALRVNFDDLDLLKILNMDPVTTDCVEKMPDWLKDLSGKKVRIRGFMKPGLLSENIPQFVLVRDQGLCCFGPKGKIYHLISTTLKKGTVTDYIELRPFDVLGTFRIGVLQLDDGTIFQLYYLDDAAIIQK